MNRENFIRRLARWLRKHRDEISTRALATAIVAIGGWLLVTVWNLRPFIAAHPYRVLASAVIVLAVVMSLGMVIRKRITHLTKYQIWMLWCMRRSKNLATMNYEDDGWWWWTMDWSIKSKAVGDPMSLRSQFVELVDRGLVFLQTFNEGSQIAAYELTESGVQEAAQAEGPPWMDREFDAAMELVEEMSRRNQPVVLEKDDSGNSTIRVGRRIFGDEMTPLIHEHYLSGLNFLIGRSLVYQTKYSDKSRHYALRHDTVASLKKTG